MSEYLVLLQIPSWLEQLKHNIKNYASLNMRTGLKVSDYKRQRCMPMGY